MFHSGPVLHISKVQGRAVMKTGLETQDSWVLSKEVCDGEGPYEHLHHLPAKAGLLALFRIRSLKQLCWFPLGPLYGGFPVCKRGITNACLPTSKWCCEHCLLLIHKARSGLKVVYAGGATHICTFASSRPRQTTLKQHLQPAAVIQLNALSQHTVCRLTFILSHLNACRWKHHSFHLTRVKLAGLFK